MKIWLIIKMTAIENEHLVFDWSQNLCCRFDKTSPQTTIIHEWNVGENFVAIIFPASFVACECVSNDFSFSLLP